MSESLAQPWQAWVAVAAPARSARPGSIIRLARLARGETQLEAGQACGFSQSQISRIESGKAHAYDIRHLARLARHPDIPPQLLGLAPASVDPREPPVNRREFVTAAATAVAGAAMDAVFTSELIRSRWLTDGHVDAIAMTDLDFLRRDAARVKANYQACRYAETGAQLPDVLTTLDAARSALTGDGLLAAEAPAADAYHVAASLQLKFGNEGPAWMAADASMRAGQQSEDPIAVASSARIVTHVLMDARRHRDAETLPGGWPRSSRRRGQRSPKTILLRCTGHYCCAAQSRPQGAETHRARRSSYTRRTTRRDGLERTATFVGGHSAPPTSGSTGVGRAACGATTPQRHMVERPRPL
jgi:transcriptional regulator with XRE-family HTH domain